jgi:hypothetical protein
MDLSSQCSVQITGNKVDNEKSLHNLEVDQTDKSMDLSFQCSVQITGNKVDNKESSHNLEENQIGENPQVEDSIDKNMVVQQVFTQGTQQQVVQQVAINKFFMSANLPIIDLSK